MIMYVVVFSGMFESERIWIDKKNIATKFRNVIDIKARKM